MNRVRTALLTLAAVAALAPSLTFALDTEGGDGGHDLGEGSTPAPQQQSGGGVVYDNDDDEDATLATGNPLQGQPKVTKKLPGLCKVLGC